MLGKRLHGLWFHGPALACLTLVLQSLCRYQPYSNCWNSHLSLLPPQTFSVGKGDFYRERYSPVWETEAVHARFHYMVIDACMGCATFAGGKRQKEDVFLLQKWGGGVSSAPGELSYSLMYAFIAVSRRASVVAHLRFGPMGSSAGARILKK